MKNVLKYFLLLVIAIGIGIAPMEAKSKKSIELPEKVEARVENKVEETTKKITKELTLTDKQVRKVHAIKLQEARAIEWQRLENGKSQHDIKNEILLIKADASKKVSKVLKRDQRVLWEVKKENYVYNPGLLENIKDVYKQTKENIQEKLGLD